MAGPSDVTVREPAVAGLFYPDDSVACRAEARKYLCAAQETGNANLKGAIVPHAGWICSGAVAGEAIATLAESCRADVVVVFGAIHTRLETRAAAFDVHRRWRVPGGESQIAEEIQAKLLEASGLFVVDERFHRREHAVEVELPLIQLAWGEALLLPMEVPLAEQAVEMGRQTARQIEKTGVKAVYLASSDLTHYGVSYEFAPAGLGMPGMQWEKDNDRRLLAIVTEFAAERVVREVREHGNACGGGAIAAMLAACREIGAGEARVLRHTNSYETLAAVAPQRPDNAVGYAGVIVA